MLPLLAEVWDLLTYALLYTAWLWGPASVLGLAYTWARLRVGEGKEVEAKQVVAQASVLGLATALVCFSFGGDAPDCLGMSVSLALLCLYLVWRSEAELAQVRMRARWA